MEKEIQVKPGKYRHFKGMEVEVLGTANHSETLEEMVVYKEGGRIWVRPKEMFLGTVNRDGKVMKRFEKIKD